MKRRRLLAALGGSLALAGCLSRGSEPGITDSPTGSTGSAGTDSPEAGDPTGTSSAGTWSDPDPFSLGEAGGANPHELTVDNSGDVARTVELRITDVERESILLDRSYTLPPGEGIGGSLRGPAEYEVRVALPGAGTEHVTTVDYFDTCNDYGTEVTIGADGSLSSETFTTAMECDPTPTETPDPGGTPSSEEFAIGETTRDANPHGLTVHNDGDESWTVELGISDADTGETLFDRSYSLDGGEEVGGVLRGPARYEVRVSLPDAGTEHVTTVAYFDTCNSYTTTVTIAADGALSSATIKTEAWCGPPLTPARF